MHTRCCRPVSWKLLKMIAIINKSLLLHLVGVCIILSKCSFLSAINMTKIVTHSSSWHNRSTESYFLPQIFPMCLYLPSQFSCDKSIKKSEYDSACVHLWFTISPLVSGHTVICIPAFEDGKNPYSKPRTLSVAFRFAPPPPKIGQTCYEDRRKAPKY